MLCGRAPIEQSFGSTTQTMAAIQLETEGTNTHFYSTPPSSTLRCRLSGVKSSRCVAPWWAMISPGTSDISVRSWLKDGRNGIQEDRGVKYKSGNTGDFVSKTGRNFLPGS